MTSRPCLYFLFFFFFFNDTATTEIYTLSLHDALPIRPARLVLTVPAWTAWLSRSFGVAHLGVVRHLGGECVGGLGRGVGHVLAGGIGFVDPRLRILRIGALAVLARLFLAAILLALLAFLLVGLGAAVLAHIERIEEIMDGVAEACLVLDQPFEPIEIAPGAVLDQRAPQIDDLLSRRRRGLAGQPLPHHHRDRFLDGRIRP